MKKFYKKYYKKIRKAEVILLKQIEMRINNLTHDDETRLVEHLLHRIKTPDSTIKKLNNRGYEATEENAIEFLSDVVGIRLIAHFIGDIYVIRNSIAESTAFNIIKEKDYVKNPKNSGYRGYHIIVSIDVDDVPIKAEIQIRTIAMDCWASLEHQIRYKKNRDSEKIDLELKKCSDDLMSADVAMEQIWKMIEK